MTSDGVQVVEVADSRTVVNDALRDRALEQIIWVKSACGLLY